jgi:hypothetical protein
MSNRIQPGNLYRLLAVDGSGYVCQSPSEAAEIAATLDKLNQDPKDYYTLRNAVELYRSSFSRAQESYFKRDATTATSWSASLAEYKKRVAAVAMKYAVTYDWCDQVRDAMTELDIELPDPQVTGSVTVTYPFTATVPFDHLSSLTAGGKEFVLKQLEVPSLCVKPSDVFVVKGGMIDPSTVELTEIATQPVSTATPTPTEYATRQGMPF